MTKKSILALLFCFAALFSLFPTAMAAQSAGKCTVHSWDGGTLITAPTCTDEGVSEYRCVYCGLRRLEWASAKGHTPGKTSVCTEPRICTVCGDVISDALGHNYIALVTAPSCTEEGYTTLTCSHCGDSVTKERLFGTAGGR